MLKVNVIDCKTKDLTVIYLFTLAKMSKNIITGNISVFEELNVNQLGLFKENHQFKKLFTIW